MAEEGKKTAGTCKNGIYAHEKAHPTKLKGKKCTQSRNVSPKKVERKRYTEHHPLIPPGRYSKFSKKKKKKKKKRRKNPPGLFGKKTKCRYSPETKQGIK